MTPPPYTGTGVRVLTMALRLVREQTHLGLDVAGIPKLAEIARCNFPDLRYGIRNGRVA